jgi:hypothetical protein
MEIVPALFSVSFLPYFIQKATIKGVQILYNNEAFGFNWEVDLSLLLEIHRRNGSTYEYQLNIRGTFKRDSSGKITGWGSCFKLQKLFQCLKINGVVNSDGTITQNSLDELVNKEVCVLSYINGLKDDGNNRYQLWDILSNDRLVLEQDFQSSIEKGYPRNYHPELLFAENKTQESNQESEIANLKDFDF